MAQVMIEHVKKRGRIETVASGMENLPTEGGYIMFANHQGKYDALGVISVHEKPCTYVMDAKRSHLFIVTQLCELLKAKRLDKTDLRQQVQVINDVATEVKAGRRYILFPEGGYDHNHNSLRGFLPGSFKIAQKAKCPIVPVALIDTYKAFDTGSAEPLTVQVHFLKPMYYDEYKDMKTTEIAAEVKRRVEETIKEYGGWN